MSESDRDTGDRARSDRGFVVRGRVQGVGYRWWARGVATELGVLGFVRNEPDGSVLLHARGDDPVLRRLEERLRVGPAVAKVESVEVVACELPSECSAFVIAY